MKTDISIPNPIYRAAEKLAEEPSISLSELYTAALSAYISKHERRSVVEKLNAIYWDESSSINPELRKIQIAKLEHEQW